MNDEPIKRPGSAEPLPNKCGSHLKSTGPDDPRDGRFCTRPAGWGTPHVGSGTCKMHLGCVTTHVRSAERKEVEKVVTRLQEELGTPTPLRDPYLELWDLTAKIKQWSDIAETHMAELNEMSAFDIKGTEQIRAAIELYERAIERTRDTLGLIIKLDLKRRLVELEEQQGALIASVIMGVIEAPELHLDDDQVEMARMLMGRGFDGVSDRLRIPGMPEMSVLGAVLVER